MHQTEDSGAKEGKIGVFFKKMSISCCFLYIKTPEMQKVTKKIVDLKKKVVAVAGGGTLQHFQGLRIINF